VSSIKIVAIVVIVLGIAALAYGGFNYRGETHGMKVGPLEMSVTERKTVNVPVWAGVGAVVVGGALLLLPRRKG
jgi:uncharacterized membrane protein YidH (DUF202 family)